MNCGKCHGSFEKEGRDPLLLPSCGHTLCRSCLKLFTQHNGFKCPFCGMKQPKVNLAELLPNFALLEIIASVNGDENGRPGRRRGRDRSVSRAPSGDKGREESLQRNPESECMEHEAVRLTYWCGPCGVAACGECVVEKHSGNTGGRRHQAVRIDDALKTRRSELEDLVFEVTRSMDCAEEKRTTFAKSSPFIAGAKKLHSEVGAVWGKLKIVASLLACLIQESEDGDAGLRQLRQGMDKFIQKAPASSPATGNVSEIRALMKHLRSIENFRDGPVAKVLKEVDALGKEDRQKFLSVASTCTAVLNVKAAALCRQVVCCGDGCHLEVVGSNGLVGSLTWDDNELHLHCLRHPSSKEPRRPASDPSRRNALKWSMVQTQLHEVTQVFLVLARGTQGQAGAVRENVYLKLCHPDTNTISVSEACHRFLHLVLGDDGTNSLLGSVLTGDVQDLAGVRIILLGAHHHQEEGEGKKSKEGTRDDTTSKADSNPTTSTASPVTLSAGDVICMKGREREGDAEFWLVIDGITRITKPLSACEVVGTLITTHKSPQAKLPNLKLSNLKGMRIEDCGAVLTNEREAKGAARTSPAAPSARVTPSVHPKNAAEGNHKGLKPHHDLLLSHDELVSNYDELDFIS